MKNRRRQVTITISPESARFCEQRRNKLGVPVSVTVDRAIKNYIKKTGM